MNLADLIMQETRQEQPQTILDVPIITGGVVETNQPLKNWLSDFRSGYRDNYKNRWGQTDLPQEKNWATRIGEGLGTVGRFIDSPTGRFALAAGLNSALGYNNSLQEGLNAAIGRQNAQTADRVYRKQLEQMGYSQQDLDNITGDITPSIYKGLAYSFRLGNQRMTYGQLAMFDNDIAELLRANPDLENQFIPLSMARDIYTKRKQKAEVDIEKTKADTEGSKARTEKTKAETGQVGKPRVSINIKQGGTHSVIEHKGGNGGSGGKTTATNKTIRPIGQNTKKHNRNAF